MQASEAQQGIAVSMRLDYDGIKTRLVNETAREVRILWEACRFVDIEGAAHAVLHLAGELGPDGDPQRPTRVAPGAELVDTLVASSLVQREEVDGQRRLRVLDHLPKGVGVGGPRTVSVLLALADEGGERTRLEVKLSVTWDAEYSIYRVPRRILWSGAGADC